MRGHRLMCTSIMLLCHQQQQQPAAEAAGGHALGPADGPAGGAVVWCTIKTTHYRIRRLFAPTAACEIGHDSEAVYDAAVWSMQQSGRSASLCLGVCWSCRGRWSQV